MIDLKGQTAIVGGGAGEIGAATARALAELGARVWIMDRDGARVERVRGELAGDGLEVRSTEADLTSATAVQETVDAAISEWGRIDIAVNTVGWTDARPFVSEDEAYWRRIVDVNLMSAVFLTSRVLPHMQRQRYGRIVLVSSLAGRIGRRERVLYSACKAGVIGFAKAVALEVAPQEVTVNCIAPGATDTALMRAQGDANTEFALAGIPRGRFAAPEDQARGIAFLASPAAAQITGQTLAIDGGATMV
ncbi:MAG TPA: SDR family NAD(P)-dependent oxidoreductase [Solirubrobacterales bacterium]|nr:SDR family NAD(P)-dependent oxidoreductase [Solirubrobacterales bacterium]